MTKQKLIYALLAAYVLIVFISTIFHGYNFTWYTNNKGGESIVYMEFLFFTSIAFQGLMWWLLKTIKIAAAILSTLVNLFVSMVIVFGVMAPFDFDPSPRGLIFTYGVSYITVFIAIVAWQVNKVTRESGYHSTPL